MIFSRTAALALGFVAAGVVGLAGCGSSGSVAEQSPSVSSSAAGGDEGNGTSSDRFPDVVDVKVSADGGGAYTFDVTMTSPYDTPERYADGWRVLGPDGKVFGEMTLGHDHAAEQPFTRTETGVAIPAGVSSVRVQGHDKDNGYGGKTKTVDVPAA